MGTLISVCGNGRSGTTMLHTMLANAPDAFGCGEIHNWFRPWRTSHFTIECPCGQKPCPFWEKVQNVPQQDFHQAVIERLGMNFVVDQSKYIPWVVDSQKWAAAHNLKIYNVLAWKDPVDLSYSYWKRERNPMLWRHSFVHYYSKFFKVGLPFVSINYSELILEPKQKLTQLCNAVGMPYFEGKENFWEKEHHHLFGSLGIRRQVESRNSQFKTKRTFAPEFEAGLPDLMHRIETDTQVQQIITALKAQDVSLVNDPLPRGHHHQPPIIYPAWYYLQRGHRKLKRYFPNKFDPYANEQLETIPNREDPKPQQQQAS